MNTAKDKIIANNSIVEYDIEIIEEIIHEIINLHQKFSYMYGNLCSLNLKRNKIRDVVSIMDNNSYLINNNFLSIVYNYLEELKMLIVDIDLEERYKHLDFRPRTKDPESVFYKIGHYFAKAGKGTYSINKCLNDLLGFRICIKNFDHKCSIFYTLCDYIKEEDYNIKCIDSSKGDYKATHIYIKGPSNKFFPWELQVWNLDDREVNYESHKMHKQMYKKSAEIHKNGFTIVKRP
ncbi:hypothetical protein [Virgibacillus sp. Bac330]|uniref:hypothetical protein n=1 Tax=Virgibacillus sp. Bac330 TaxID=2419841 RepID=UPI0013CEA78F|nr:hypothetical protein [Virgibacillus sp. Bac330]